MSVFLGGIYSVLAEKKELNKQFDALFKKLIKAQNTYDKTGLLRDYYKIDEIQEKLNVISNKLEKL